MQTNQFGTFEKPETASKRRVTPQSRDVHWTMNLLLEKIHLIPSSTHNTVPWLHRCIEPGLYSVYNNTALDCWGTLLCYLFKVQCAIKNSEKKDFY